MPEFHVEPYLHLSSLSHKSALIAWGAFSREQWKLVDDRDLRHVHPPRRESIGAHAPIRTVPLYLRERIASDESSGGASVGLGLFCRFRYGRDVEFNRRARRARRRSIAGCPAIHAGR